MDLRSEINGNSFFKGLLLTQNPVLPKTKALPVTKEPVKTNTKRILDEGSHQKPRTDGQKFDQPTKNVQRFQRPRNNEMGMRWPNTDDVIHSIFQPINSDNNGTGHPMRMTCFQQNNGNAHVSFQYSDRGQPYSGAHQYGYAPPQPYPPAFTNPQQQPLMHPPPQYHYNINININQPPAPSPRNYIPSLMNDQFLNIPHQQNIAQQLLVNQQPNQSNQQYLRQLSKIVTSSIDQQSQVQHETAVRHVESVTRSAAERPTPTATTATTATQSSTSKSTSNILPWQLDPLGPETVEFAWPEWKGYHPI